MRRSASEIIRNLEMRLARLEKQSYRVRPRTEAQMESYDSDWGRKHHYRVFDTERDVERYIKTEFGLKGFEFERVPNKNYGRYFINLKQVRKAIRWEKMIQVHSLEYDKHWNVEKDSKWLRPSRLRKEARVKKWTAKSVVGRKWNGYMSDIQKMEDKAFKKIKGEAEDIIRDTLIDELSWDCNMSELYLYAIEGRVPPMISFNIKSPPKEWFTDRLRWVSSSTVASLQEKFNGEVKVTEKNKMIWFNIFIESYSYDS